MSDDTSEWQTVDYALRELAKRRCGLDAEEARLRSVLGDPRGSTRMHATSRKAAPP
jgi:hypothetical protein